MANFIKRLRLALFPKPLKVGRGKNYQCIGGPYDGESLHLRTSGTLTFTIGGQTGRYVLNPDDEHQRQLVWCPVIKEYA